MKTAEAITKTSFNITGRGVVLELKHWENGLPKETELTSQKSGLKWKVVARVLFDHAVQEQQIFESESSEYMLLRFDNQEKEVQSINEIKEREAQNVYLYLLKPVGHDGKPEEGEKFIICLPEHKL